MQLPSKGAYGAGPVLTREPRGGVRAAWAHGSLGDTIHHSRVDRPQATVSASVADRHFPLLSPAKQIWAAPGLLPLEPGALHTHLHVPALSEGPQISLVGAKQAFCTEEGEEMPKTRISQQITNRFL